MKKIFLTSGLMMCVVMPAMAVPTNTSNTFPNDELMQADYTYTNQATYENTGVYSDSVDAEANYEYIDITVPAGKYLPAGQTTVQNCPGNYYCPGLAQPVHYDAQNDQGAIACSTVGDGTFASSLLGATTDTQCFRTCSVNNMGTTITNYPHATMLSFGADYYGGTENDTCTVVSCENGYHADNNACVANTITINWNGATAAAISANNAGTTTYGGDIRTPQSIDPSQVPVGKRFVGWKFVKQVLFDLSTLDPSISATGFSDVANFGQYKLKVEGRCSAKTGDNHDHAWGGDSSDWKATENELTGNGTGQYCWCKVTQYQANGTDEWKNVLPVPWVFLYEEEEGYDCDDSDCEFGCIVGFGNGQNQNNVGFRSAAYGITQ